MHARPHANHQVAMSASEVGAAILLSYFTAGDSVVRLEQPYRCVYSTSEAEQLYRSTLRVSDERLSV